MSGILRLFSKAFSGARAPLLEIPVDRQPHYRWGALGFGRPRRPDMAGE
jgi:hypothetical protein